MSNLFVIGDPHFCTPGIMNIPGRKELYGNQTRYEHDEMLIDNWNRVVTEKDTVYLMGDVGRIDGLYFAGAVRPRLTGKIHVIGGNHDTPEILQLFDKVHGCVDKTINGLRCILTHIPIHPQEMFWDYNLHGHIHLNTVKMYANTPAMGVIPGEADLRYINTCVEHHNMSPVNMEELVEQRQKARGKI